jgi:single-strand DNA-binding protein
MNKIILIGNVGQDPTIRNAQGANVATYSVAVNKRKKDANGAPIDVTTWFNCESWNKGAEFAEKFLKKGMKLFVEGELNVDKYNDKDGIERTSIKVRVERVEILSSLKDNNGQSVQQEATIPASTETADEDLPF